MKITIPKDGTVNCISIPAGEYAVHVAAPAQELGVGDQLVLSSGWSAISFAAARRETEKLVPEPRVRIFPTLAPPLWVIQVQAPPATEWVAFIRVALDSPIDR